jgi:hypothetical protein
MVLDNPIGGLGIQALFYAKKITRIGAQIVEINCLHVKNVLAELPTVPYIAGTDLNLPSGQVVPDQEAGQQAIKISHKIINSK